MRNQRQREAEFGAFYTPIGLDRLIRASKSAQFFASAALMRRVNLF